MAWNVQNYSQQIALIDEKGSMTYKEMDELSDAVAVSIRKAGVGSSAIALLMSASNECIVTMLGILKAGCCFVPLDVELPEERRKFILQDAGCVMLFDRTNYPFGEVIDENIVSHKKDALPGVAYIIYTSGTTGKPKGIPIKHSALNQTILSNIEILNLNNQSRVLQFANISFDASTGKLVKYIDGLEEEVVYLTSTGDKTGSPYIAEFDNIKLDPLYLGQGFIGGMDLFYFTPTYKQNFNLYKYSLDGEIISKVIDFNDKNTFIDAINYTGKYTNGSYIDLYYRTSDYYFAPDDNNIAWQLLNSGINTNVSNSNSVRYMQIRAVLKSNVDRNITPTLNNVDIVYHKGRLPQVPVNLTATAVNNNSVVLRWEGDHKDIVGYKIYYGTKSGVYNEAEHTPIIVGNQNEYYVEGLKENEVYYFTITAIGGESGDIESGFSKEVYVRAVH